MGECFGECDEDSNCAGDLECYQRDAHEIPPGCADRGNDNLRGWDICYDPNKVGKEISYDYKDGGKGAAIYVAYGASVTVTSCDFIDNMAGAKGGAFTSWDVEPKLRFSGPSLRETPAQEVMSSTMPGT